VSDSISAEDETIIFFMNDVMGCIDAMFEDQKPEPVLCILPERPVIPGFAWTADLNVNELPVKHKDRRREEASIFMNLGNFFMWPFTYRELHGIVKFLREDDKGVCRKNYGNIEDLKEQCEVVKKALKKDNKRFNALVGYVARYNSINSHRLQICDTNLKATIERKVREHYEQVIVEKIWPILWEWFTLKKQELHNESVK
jgi:hypothetical protein